MKLRSVLGSACGLMLVACAGGDQQEATAGEPEAVTPVVDDGAAITELADYYETHFNMHHAPMVADVYAEDGTFLAATGEILEGREAITAFLQEGMDTASPELTISQADQVIAGNRAVARGTYTFSGETEGTPIQYGGAFLNALEKTGDEWKVSGTVTNFDSEAAAEFYAGGDEEGEAPEEEGTLTGLYEALETHYNLGHASMVADLFTADAQVAFAYSPWISGTEAITAAVQERMDSGSQMDIHGVVTQDLGNGLFADWGWYEISSAEGEPITIGAYAALVEQTAEGEARIRWHVSNGSPRG